MERPEVWLRGPIKEIPVLLQPTAHALMQSREEVLALTKDFPKSLLWKELKGRASVGFHLNHLTGVLDRMLTYAKEKELDEKQFKFLKNEGNAKNEKSINELVEAFSLKIDEALDYFKSISSKQLIEKRTVGRKRLPSTVLGLLFHAAEHSQRHIGQLIVTMSWVKSL